MSIKTRFIFCKSISYNIIVCNQASLFIFLYNCSGREFHENRCGVSRQIDIDLTLEIFGDILSGDYIEEVFLSGTGPVGEGFFCGEWVVAEVFREFLSE